MPQSPFSDMPEPVVTVHDDERGGDSFSVSGSEYRELLRIAREHVTMLKQMFQIKRTNGNPDWTATYWDCRQGMSQEDARAVSCMQFNDGITVYELLGTGHRTEEGIEAQLNVAYSVAEIVHNGTIIASFDVTDIVEMYHDPQRRALAVQLPNTTYEIECYDQSVLRALYYSLLLRHQDQRESIDPIGHTNQAVNDAVPRLLVNEEGAGAFSPSASMVRMVPSAMMSTPVKSPAEERHMSMPSHVSEGPRAVSKGATHSVAHTAQTQNSRVSGGQGFRRASQSFGAGITAEERQNTMPQFPSRVQSTPPSRPPQSVHQSQSHQVHPSRHSQSQSQSQQQQQQQEFFSGQKTSLAQAASRASNTIHAKSATSVPSGSGWRGASGGSVSQTPVSQVQSIATSELSSPQHTQGLSQGNTISQLQQHASAQQAPQHGGPSTHLSPPVWFIFMRAMVAMVVLETLFRYIMPHTQSFTSFFRSHTNTTPTVL